FFFQAEDGIRDFHVTGVQTCALPISRTYPTGTVLNFNGTTEWALDNVSKDDALWLPREDQLRTLLGGTFRSLERVDGQYVVTATGPGGEERTYRAAEVENAYAVALLALVRHAVGHTRA